MFFRLLSFVLAVVFAFGAGVLAEKKFSVVRGFLSEVCPCNCGCNETGKCDCGDSCPCKCGCGKTGKCNCKK